MRLKTVTTIFIRFVPSKNWRFCFSFTAVILFFAFINNLYAQSPSLPPKTIQVYAAQELSFGSFYTGSSGGAVIVSPQGYRSCSGTVLSIAVSEGTPAIFDLRLIAGRIVHIVFPSTAELMRVGSGETMEITDFCSDKTGDSFITTAAHPFINPVQVGATLLVGSTSANPPGDYVGSFSVTFIQE